MIWKMAFEASGTAKVNQAVTPFPRGALMARATFTLNARRWTLMKTRKR
jgi:hypothetical protein